MAIQKPTDEQIKNANDNKDLCEKSLAQTLQQAATEQMKKAKEQLDKVNQELSQIPEKAVENLNNAIDMLMKLISDYKNTESPDFNPDEVIAKLEAMLKPVLNALSSLPVPEIPGLAQIAKLLDALKQLISSLNISAGGNQSIQSQVPPELMTMLRDLLTSLLSLSATLPLVLINLIWQMFNAIIGMFKQIAGVIGVPSIPYPLNLIPKCITMMPDLMMFMMKAPCQIVGATLFGLKNAFGQITNMQIPNVPDDVEQPEKLPSCPQRDKAAT